MENEITKFKEIHSNSDEVDPHILWDTLKCDIRGATIQYSARQKKRLMFYQLRIKTELKNFDTDLLKIDVDKNSILQRTFLKQQQLDWITKQS